MDEHYIGLADLEDVAHAGEDACGYVIEILTLLHDVEVVIGLDIEDAEYLVEHLAMLTGDAYDGFELFWVLLEFLYQWAHLDCLRSGAEDEHYCFHILISIFLS